VALAAILILVGIAAAALTLTRSTHSSADTACSRPVAAAACTVRPETPVTPAPRDAREAFAQCMAGQESGASPPRLGRFGGGGPSQAYRLRFELCRSLAQTAAQGPAQPAPPPVTANAPVA
jgi:hypothetical protein